MRMMTTTRRCHGVQPDYWKKQADVLNKGYKIAQYFSNNYNNNNNNNNNNNVVNNNSNPKNPSNSSSNKPVINGELSSVSSAGKVDDQKESREVRVAMMKARFAQVIAKYSGNKETKIVKQKEDGHQINTKPVDKRVQERQLARLALEKLEQTVQVDDYELVKKFERLAGCSISGSGYAGSCSAWKKSLKNLGLVMKNDVYGY